MARHQQNIGTRRQVRKQTAFLNDVTNSVTQRVDVCLRDP